MGSPVSNARFLSLCSTAVLSVASYATLSAVGVPMAYAASSANSGQTSAGAQTTLTSAEQVATRLEAVAKTRESAARNAVATAARAQAIALRASTTAKAHPASASAKRNALAKAAVAHTAAVRAAVARAAARRATAAAKAAEVSLVAAKAAATQTVSTQKYKDGTYTGVGQTAIGAVQVQVTLKADKIMDVKITGYTTHYPISYIDPILPQELLQVQDVNQIQIVSGATLSTADFYYAVKDCLQQAQKA